MWEVGGSDQAKPYNEFKFWSNNFDGLRFLYNHLNTIEDVNKAKIIGRQKLTPNPSSYIMRYIVLIQGLFESGYDYEHNEIKLDHEINQLKEQQKMQTNKIFDLEKKLLDEKSKRGKLEVEN